MRIRLVAIFAAALLGACGPTPSPTPAAVPRPTESTAEPSPTAEPGTSAACGAAERRQADVNQDFGPGYAPERGSDGGHLSLGVVGRPTELDPLRAVEGADLLLANALWRGLVRWTSDFRVTGDLATVPPSLDNGLVRIGADGSMTVEWCLHQSAWSDGVPLTCADYQYGLEWLRDVEPALAARFGPIKTLDCPSPLVAIVRYSSVFEAYFTRTVPALPRHALEGQDLVDLRAGGPFRPSAVAELPTSGPFRISQMTPDGPIELVRNDGYHGGSRGEPAYLDSLSILPYATSAGLISDFRAGRLQMAAGLAPGEIPDLEAMGLSDSIAAYPGLGYESLLPNLAGPSGSQPCSESAPVAGRGAGCPTADPAIRLAISESIDRQAIADALGPRDAEQLVGAVVVPQAWFYSDIAPGTHDLDAAREGLNAAGWRDANGNGIRERAGLEARIELCTSDDPAHAAAAQVVTAELAAVGLAVVPHLVPLAVIDAPYESTTRTSPCAITHGNFDLALLVRQTSLDPSDYRLRYHSASREPAGDNVGQVAFPEIDRTLDIASSTVDFSVVKDALVAFQQAVADHVIEIPISAPRSVDLIEAADSGPLTVGNYFSSPTASMTWNAEDWFVKPPLTTHAPTP